MSYVAYSYLSVLLYVFPLSVQFYSVSGGSAHITGQCTRYVSTYFSFCLFLSSFFNSVVVGDGCFKFVPIKDQVVFCVNQFCSRGVIALLSQNTNCLSESLFP